MRALLLLALASSSSAIAQDYYSFYEVAGSVYPQPPGVITYTGDQPAPYHCYVTYVGVSPYPEFSLECWAIGTVYPTNVNDLAGGAIDGECTVPVTDNIYADDYLAGVSPYSIDGGGTMSVQGYPYLYYTWTNECSAGLGCFVVDEDGPDDQPCGSGAQ